MRRLCGWHGVVNTIPKELIFKLYSQLQPYYEPMICNILHALLDDQKISIFLGPRWHVIGFRGGMPE